MACTSRESLSLADKKRRGLKFSSLCLTKPSSLVTVKTEVSQRSVLSVFMVSISCQRADKVHCHLLNCRLGIAYRNVQIVLREIVMYNCSSLLFLYMKAFYATASCSNI